MGFFTTASAKEARERAKWSAERSGEVYDTLKAYQKGKVDKETVRRTLARHDDYFDFTD